MSWPIPPEDQWLFYKVMTNRYQQEYYDLYFVENQKQQERLKFLHSNLVPYLINLAHLSIGPQNNQVMYREKLLAFLRREMEKLPRPMRRVIQRHVEHQDNWLTDGGPSEPGAWNVEADPEIDLDDIFGIKELLAWAED
ncbi:unnamed protein product [Absidia cylindrospora]